MNDIIEKFLKERFVSDVGFAKCEDTPFPGLENAVSLVFHLSDAVVDEITDCPTHTYFHHYRTMNAYIDSVSLQLVLMLQEKGIKAAAIPASQSIEGLQALYSHKKAAVKAGLGSIGKSALFLSEKYGPRWSNCQKPLSKTSGAKGPWEIRQNAEFGVCSESLMDR